MSTATLAPCSPSPLAAALEPLPAWWPRALRSTTAIVAGHALVFVLAHALALAARYALDDGEPPAWRAVTLVPIAVLVKLAAVAAFGLLRGPFRYASLRDAVHGVYALSTATLLLLGLRSAVPAFRAVPSGLIAIDWAFTVLAYGGARMALRLLRERRGARARGALKRALVLGAGDAGEVLIRDLLAHPEQGIEPVGFLDDDASKHGLRISRLPILGPCDGVGPAAARMGATLALVAMPRATGAQRRRVVRLAQEAGLECRTVPSLGQLVSGEAVVSQVRKVEIADLLGRPAVETDLRAIGERIRGKTVLVTGACGSIGSELCRQIARFEPATLVALDRSETGLFWLERELHAATPSLRVELVLCDVADPNGVQSTFAAYRPELVFHAAAYKHVPLMERSPVEVVRNNVLGTMIVADAAEASGCATFVLISTDKAVQPANNMGASKRLAELYLLRRSREGARTCFVSVRFGNVLGSAGSVVQILQKQIEQGGPVTITHPEMKRFFMTVGEAVQLVLQAAELGRGREIFVLDMGEPVSVLDMANDLIRLSGLRPGADVEVVVTGMRPGEKLEETLHADDEVLAATAHPRIRVLSDPATEPADWERLRALCRDRAPLAREAALEILDQVRVRTPARTVTASAA